jgi:site-specific DNA-methyltransferase (adenine-specific)
MTPYYSDDYVTIYHGDCREILPGLDGCDMVLTDPPFSAKTHDNAKSNKGSRHGIKSIDFKSIDFKSIDFEEVRNAITAARSRRWSVMTVDFRHAARFEDHPPTGHELVRVGAWVKTNPMPQISADRPASGWEAIAYLHRADMKKEWNGGGCHGNYISNVDNTTAHPTSKPISMVRSFVERFSLGGDLVLDPFMGGGTTLRAAKDLGRKAIGIELDERYCEIAAKRCAQEVLDFSDGAA